MMKWIARQLGLVMALILVAAPAFARDSDDLQERLEDANVRLTTLETHEYADEAAAEFGQARLEVADAQGKLSISDYGWATIVINRLEARLDLIESTLERATIEALADQRETELFEMQTEADERQLELEAAQQLRQQLQDQVSQVVDQMNAEQK